MNEKDTFGEFKATKAYRDAFQKAANIDGYLPRDGSLAIVRDFSKEDPTNPKKPFANELRMAIIEELGLETVEEMDRVKFFSAVGKTSADIYHGIDAWVEYDFGDGRRAIVTLDATKNTAKQSAKADVVIQEITDPSEDEGKFIEQAEQYGSEVARMLQERIREQKLRDAA